MSGRPASGFGGDIEVTRHAEELRTVSAEHVVGVVIALSLVGYLVLARLYPERF
ncbi:potassium-transporting ATPase subunit F [Streptomyces sp. G45]|uniref:potassium-transporting ATPase subunit F n=1 Tax=Streptomyces sp. G45 TaxID=3406627 RepID=UPI003C261ABB